MLFATKVHVGDAIDSKDIDPLMASLANSMDSISSEYGMLATRLELSSIYREAEPSFSSAMETAKLNGRISGRFMELVNRNRKTLNSMIELDRDNYFTYSALRSLREKYLLQKGCVLIERPQYLWLRVALQMHLSDMEGVKIAYDLMSCLKYIPDASILTSSGTTTPGMSSSYLMSVFGDREGLFSSMERAAKCFYTGGSIGVGLQRSEQHTMRPVLELFEAATGVLDLDRFPKYGSVALYLEPWHAAVQTFLRKCQQRPCNEEGSKGPVYGLMVNDFFMQKVEMDGLWTMFCPSDAYRLITSHGPEFEQEYLRLENGGFGKLTVKARVLWDEIMETQVKFGGPVILFKEASNKKSNQRHIGVLTQSNSLGDHLQIADQQETAVTFSASIILSAFVDTSCQFEFSELGRTVRNTVISLNHILAQSYYPDNSAKASAFRHRAITIGVQGLGDTLAMLGLSYESEDARTFNAAIAETVYFSAMDESCDLIRIHGPYPHFNRSPSSTGWLQIDYWDDPIISGRHDFRQLREKVVKGTCNALVTGYAPSSSAIELASCSEGCEPLSDLISIENTSLKTTRPVVSKHLIKTLEAAGLWSEVLLNRIITQGGSIQGIEDIPGKTREIYKTAWEIDPEKHIGMAVARAPFICQSQSINAYMKHPSVSNLTDFVFSAWKAGLKTGLCSLRSRSISPGVAARAQVKEEQNEVALKGAGTTHDPYYVY
ncbi:ribonucleotide reductase [Ephemerocybe angulata]|uniref:Ribonucleoside-diphosphate reductase n=1 Tax=Ephemerocybe angulata TaxID=980116 RepID=A0A8H6HQW0_9AGAR|nr:ribonucleotide reductase [Tulosesus angulatus]